MPSPKTPKTLLVPILGKLNISTYAAMSVDCTHSFHHPLHYKKIVVVAVVIPLSVSFCRVLVLLRLASRLGSAVKEGPGAKSKDTKDPFSSHPR